MLPSVITTEMALAMPTTKAPPAMPEMPLAKDLAVPLMPRPPSRPPNTAMKKKMVVSSVVDIFLIVAP